MHSISPGILICDYSSEDRVYVVWVAAVCIHVCWVRASCVDTYMDTCVGYQHCVHVRVYTCIHDVQPSYMYMYILPDVHVHVHVHDAHTHHTCIYMKIHVHSTLHVQSKGSRRGRTTHPNHTHNAQAHPHDEEDTQVPSLENWEVGYQLSLHTHTQQHHTLDYYTHFRLQQDLVL